MARVKRGVTSRAKHKKVLKAVKGQWGRRKNTYHCFGCNAHGDAFKFLMDKENIDFPEALRRLADISGVNLPEKINYDPVEKQKREIIQNINEEAKKFICFSTKKEIGRAHV